MRTGSAILGAVTTAVFATLSPGGSSPVREAAAAECDATDVEYSVSANLRIADTLMGAGDGEYAIGPGKIVLRFDKEPGASSGEALSVKMLSYDMRIKFLLATKALFWKTQVMTDTATHATPGAGSLIAEGSLHDRSLQWSRVVGSFRTDGTLNCDGFFCGSFGAPPAGVSEFHKGPATMTFKSFEFSPDMKTFSMQSTFDSKSDSPKQMSYVALAGREVRRSCASANVL